MIANRKTLAKIRSLRSTRDHYLEKARGVQAHEQLSLYYIQLAEETQDQIGLIRSVLEDPRMERVALRFGYVDSYAEEESHAA